MKLLYDYALRLVGLPYRWGGKNPLTGLDCSGLLNLLLAPYGLAQNGDNAQMLFNHFSDPANHLSTRAQLGALAFFGNSKTQIVHCGMCLNDSQMIEAGGGDHTTLSLNDAAEKGAFVKIIPIPSNAWNQGTFAPEYPGWSYP